ncbi:hypothetical protein BKA69DRAFT_1016896, partial [Paraphysoderma sedebokerense]
RSFVCEVCDKVFHKRYNLTSHMVSHSNLRPFKCVPCGRLFARKHDCVRHVKTVH